MEYIDRAVALVRGDSFDVPGLRACFHFDLKGNPQPMQKLLAGYLHTQAWVDLVCADLASDCGCSKNSLRIPGSATVHELRLDPTWDALRDNPRFDALLTRHDANHYPYLCARRRDRPNGAGRLGNRVRV